MVVDAATPAWAASSRAVHARPSSKARQNSARVSLPINLATDAKSRPVTVTAPFCTDVVSARPETTGIDDSGMHTVTAYDDIRAVLLDPAFAVPLVPAADPPAGVAWLRAHVARFSNGPEHRRRRALAAGELAAMDPHILGRRAFERTATLARDGKPIEVMAQVARSVPLQLLADALGIGSPSTRAVSVVARAYHPHVGPDPAADWAVAELVDACGGRHDEPTAARIGLLVQACDATAGLIGSTVQAMLRTRSSRPAEIILAETLRCDPPVLRTRRITTAPARIGGTDLPPGTPVDLELAAAAARDEHLAFGLGVHACPGRAIAWAITGGILDALHGYRLLTRRVEYQPSPNTRIPAALWVSTR